MRKFALAYHTPEEWAEIRRVQLIDLGCSPEYAKKIADEYLEKPKRKREKANANL